LLIKPPSDFNLSNPEKVELTIYGHVIDENYSRLLMQRKDLALEKIILLDRIQKEYPLTEDALTLLKKDGLIEGRKPNYFISYSLASSTEEKVSYIKHKAFDDSHYKEMIIAYLRKFSKGKRGDFETLLTDKLSDVLTYQQKKDKVKNLLQALRLNGTIRLDGTDWKLN